VPTPDHRFRVEHAQLLAPQDMPRFAQLGVIPSMQGSHQTSDMSWVGTRLGPVRVQWAYAWRSLRETGVIIPNGSDAPVESINPLVSFHSFITRQDADNEPPGGWFPAQRLTREEALLGMTLWPAYASFMENDVGSLAAGTYADFVILDQDIMTVPVEKILAARVLRTVLGGRTVYERRYQATGNRD
jgi:predicted amidohydrolase YtcJ